MLLLALGGAISSLLGLANAQVDGVDISHLPSCAVSTKCRYQLYGLTMSSKPVLPITRVLQLAVR